jgi:hypothetical protein
MKSIKVLLLIGSLCLLGNVSGQEKFSLEYRYVKGTTYRYQEELKFESVQDINGQEMKATGSTFSLMKMTVESVSDSGDLSFVNSLEDLRISTKMAMMDTTMVMKDLLDKNIKTIISKRGKMVDQKIPDTVTKEDSFMGRGNSLLTLYKEFVVFPGHLLKFGDTWNDVRTDTTKGTQLVTKTDIVYTLMGVEEKNGHACLKAGFKGTTEIGGKMTQMGMDFFMEGSGEVNGNVWFDKETCIIILKESTNEQDMIMALTGQMQMTIPMTSSTNSTFTLVE